MVNMYGFRMVLVFKGKPCPQSLCGVHSLLSFQDIHLTSKYNLNKINSLISHATYWEALRFEPRTSPVPTELSCFFNTYSCNLLFLLHFNYKFNRLNLISTTSLISVNIACQSVFNKKMGPEFAMQDCYPASANGIKSF